MLTRRAAGAAGRAPHGLFSWPAVLSGAGACPAACVVSVCLGEGSCWDLELCNPGQPVACAVLEVLLAPV